MRESNFYFPSHNKASVSITSALYDRRAIDATSTLPLLSTLTHLSYLTSTSPRIREILCSDGGLERLISILRSTGRRMREHRQELLQQQQPTPLLIRNSNSSSTIIHTSPFRPFIPPQPNPSNLTTTDHHPPTIAPIPPFITQSPIQHSPSLGLTTDQKQLLWTWSLSFQCVVNIGVRGTEAIRTRVVEAGVVPVIISVLGSYLHEMDRVRQQSENLERARKKAALESAPLPSSLTHSRHLSSSGRPSSSSIDLPRPPRPVLSSRTLVHPLPNPSSSSSSSSSSISLSGLPSSFPSRSHPSQPIPLPPSSSPPPLALVSPIEDPDTTVTTTSHSFIQSSSRSSQQLRQSNHQPSHSHPNLSSMTSSRSSTTRTHPISINSLGDPVLRTGSISPSSVSSSSSLETSQLNINRQSILRSVGSSSSSSTLIHPSDLIAIDIDPHHNHEHHREDQSSPEPHSSSAAQVTDDSETDVVMELVSNDEPGPSSGGRQRSRRGTIKASQVNPHKVVHITPLAPPRPSLAEFSHDNNLPLNIESQASPMEGVEGVMDDSDENSASLYANHQTPRASSARLPHAGSGRLHHHHHQNHHQDPQVQFPSVTETIDSGSEDTPMRASTESIPRALTIDSLSSTSETDDSPPLDPTRGRTSQNIPNPDVGQLPTIISDAEDVNPARTFTPRRPVQQIAPPIAAPPPAVNELDHAALNPPTVRPAPPSVGSSSLSSPVSLLFRDEDVLLALQLLAYLSKYAHVRAYFHEPANRSTLELTYGSLQDATRALARFTGRFKTDRYERERAKDGSSGGGIQGSSSRRPCSQSTTDIDSTRLSESMAGTTNSAHHPQRSFSSSMMRDRLLAEELSRPTRSGRSSGDLSANFTTSRTPASDPGSGDSSRSMLPLGGVTLFSTSALVNHSSQSLGQPSFTAGLGQSGTHLIPAVASTCHHHSNRHYLSHQFTHGGPSQSPSDLDSTHIHQHQHPSRPQFSNSNTGTSLAHLQSTINPLASNVFSYVERFTHQRLPHDPHSPIIPTEIQYWAGVIMRNACRKDETRGGIRQCANMQCGRWESVPREFAKCRRCRKAKYCSKNCQSRAWQHGHRFWCSTRTEGEASTATNVNATNAAEGETANGTPTEGMETAVEEATRRIDRTSRALVDAAIERLRRTGEAGRREMGEISEVGSTIATPPDREMRVENRLPGAAGPPPQELRPPVILDTRVAVAGLPAALAAATAHDLVDERDQIRLMVDNPDNDQLINP